MKKIAFITGATSGIGQACARKFAISGYDLIINGRKSDKLAEMKAELEAMGAQVLVLEFDVRNREASESAINSLDEHWKCIDVLVNNAGLALGLEKEYEAEL